MLLDHLGRAAEPGVVVEAGDDGGFGAVLNLHASRHVHLPETASGRPGGKKGATGRAAVEDRSRRDLREQICGPKVSNPAPPDLRPKRPSPEWNYGTS